MGETRAKGGAKQRRERERLVKKGVRFCIQILFFILAPGLFSGAFNGVKYLAGQIGALQAFEANSFVVLLIATVAFTVVFGRFFCGYACAFGAFGDILYTLVHALLSKLHVPELKLPPRLVRVLSLVKYVVLLAIFLACVFGAWQLVSDYSPWHVFAHVTTSWNFEGLAAPALAVFSVLVVCMALRERFFCQFLCPLGALFSLLPVMPFSTYKRERENCAKRCNRCQESCPVDIHPDADTPIAGECISCGRCAQGCPMGNVNFVAIERELAEGEARRPRRKTRRTHRLFRGDAIWWTIVRACLLLVVCWVINATRYLPAFADFASRLFS